MNPDQSSSSNSNFQNGSSFTHHTDSLMSNPITSPPEPSFPTPIVPTPQAQSHPNGNGMMMNDDQLYEYLYSPERSARLSTLSDFIKSQLNQSNLIDSIQNNPSKGKFYEAWARSHSHLSNPNQESQNDLSGIGSSDHLPLMEINQTHSSEPIQDSDLAKMLYDVPNGNQFAQVGVDVEMTESEMHSG